MKALLINVANVKWVNEVRIRVKYFATACVIITENYRMYARTNDNIATRKEKTELTKIIITGCLSRAAIEKVEPDFKSLATPRLVINGKKIKNEI